MYKGMFVYQKAQSVVPGRRLSDDPHRKNRKTGRKPRPKEEWIVIRVPAVVNGAVWEAAQRQMEENSRYSRRNNKRHRYLLKGLIRYPRCGGAYTGHTQYGLRRYRCTNQDPAVSSTGKRCRPGSVSADLVEEAVWDAVSDALKQPEVLTKEYEKRLSEAMEPGAREAELKQVRLGLKKVKVQTE